MSLRIAKSLEALMGEINSSAAMRSKAFDECYHKSCDCHLVDCAVDITHDPGCGFDAHEFADWLAGRAKMGQEMRVKHIISKGRVCNGDNHSFRAGVWREHKGSDPHNTHVQVSVSHPKGLFDDSSPWGWDLHTQKQSSA